MATRTRRHGGSIAPNRIELRVDRTHPRTRWGGRPSRDAAQGENAGIARRARAIGRRGAAERSRSAAGGRRNGQPRARAPSRPTRAAPGHRGFREFARRGCLHAPRKKTVSRLFYRARDNRSSTIGSRRIPLACSGIEILEVRLSHFAEIKDAFSLKIRCRHVNLESRC